MDVLTVRPGDDSVPAPRVKQLQVVASASGRQLPQGQAHHLALPRSTGDVLRRSPGFNFLPHLLHKQHLLLSTSLCLRVESLETSFFFSLPLSARTTFALMSSLEASRKPCLILCFLLSPHVGS